ncbi:MAG: ABC transporter permease [Gammaproteobacteria bacterium]|nr:ABC transporter permease [Gammaproteobacteria bacterium]
MNLGYELHYTLRLIRRKLGFNFLCIIVIALGYLITLPVYSFVKNFAYTTLPYPDGDRLVVIMPVETPSGSEQATENFDFFQFNAIQGRSTAFEKLGAYRPIVANLSDGDFALPFSGSHITADALGFAATNPVLGRSLQYSDEQVGADPVTLISHQVWQSYYFGDPEIIGRIARVNGEATTIVGVMPEGFRYPYDEDIWQPLMLSNSTEPGEGPSVTIVGALKDGASREVATQEIQMILGELSSEHTDHYRNQSAIVQPFTQGWLNSGVFIMDSVGVAAISLFLLICLNVSNLLVIRASERVNELAIRSAVGARRIGLIGHVLLESFIVCCSGAILGILASNWLLQGMQLVFENQVSSNVQTPFWFDFTFNEDVLILSILMLIALWLLSGVFAAWHASKGDLTSTLGGDSRAVVGMRAGKITRFIVHLQMTISFFLLLVSGVFVFSFQAMNTDGVVANGDQYVVATVDMSAPAYAETAQAQRFIEQLARVLRQRNEFENVAFGTAHLAGASSAVQVTLEESIDNEQEVPGFGESWISANYFQTIEFPLLEGRIFDETDNFQSLPVVLVDTTFTTKMGMNESPVGHTIQLRDANGNSTVQATIVGVVPQSNRTSEIAPNLISLIYRPLAQYSGAPRLFSIARTDSSLTLTMSEIETIIRDAVGAVDRDVPVYAIGLLSSSLEAPRAIFLMILTMFSAAALGALALAVISIYGLIARAVFSRANEIGVRRALGSSDSRIVKLFLSQGLGYLISAFVIGGGVGVLVISILQSALSSISSFNFISTVSVVFSAVSLTVIALVCMASYVPVRRVLAMEPGDALHCK